MASWRYTDFTFRPVGGDWPNERPRLSPMQQRRSPFSASWSVTIEDLERELRQLDARQVVLQIDVSEYDLRLDGKPRANARPSSSAVVLSFESRWGPLRLACDEFSDWQENVRAIALSLEALRKIDRYGVSKRGEQFRGWKALPMAGGFSSSVEARAWLDEHGGIAAATKRFHPDNPDTGDRELFERVIAAKELVLA